MSFVLDNSVLSGWWIANQADSYTDAVAQALTKSQASAPQLLQLEFVNVIRTGCKRNTLNLETAREIIDEVAKLPIHLDDAPPSPAALLSLALRHDLTSYDATYLELALRLQLPLATRDRALADAAWASGVGVFKPA